MNILFFASRVTYGGGEKVRNWLVRQLHNSGHKIFYVTENLSKEYKEQLIINSMDGIVEAIEFHRNAKSSHPFKYIHSLKTLYRNYKIDLLMIFGGSLIEQIVARRCGVKVILSERFYNGFRPLPSRLLKRFQYRIADGYVFQTPEASRMYNRRATRIGTVIPNPIIDKLPDPIFNNLRKEIVNTGRLCDQKDQSTLIKAFKIFHETHRDYKLVIYGSGEYKERLMTLIDSLGLSDCAEIISGKSNISDRINGSAMFVLSSKAEGMPNALIEAMSMGVLSISTDCPAYGSRMLITNNENAVLVPVGDVNIMANEMCRVIEDEVLANKIRQNAVAIRDRLEPSKISTAWINYVQTIVK